MLGSWHGGAGGGGRRRRAGALYEQALDALDEGDNAAAVELMTEAADLGLVEAQYALGVEQDYDEARQWYDQAAAQGNETAREHLDALGERSAE